MTVSRIPQGRRTPDHDPRCRVRRIARSGVALWADPRQLAVADQGLTWKRAGSIQSTPPNGLVDHGQALDAGVGRPLARRITWRRKGRDGRGGRPAGAGTPVGKAGGHLMSTWLAGAPETRYAESEEAGYWSPIRSSAEGPFDLLFIGNWASNVEVMWEHPSMARYLDRLGQLARVICFDKRGAGLSDPVPLGALPTLEHWMDDARIVLDAAGSEEAALIGDAEGGPMAMMFAATYPQRTRALALVNTPVPRRTHPGREVRGAPRGLTGTRPS